MAKSEIDFEPSNLDDLTRQELRLPYDAANHALLFAKLIQWLSVWFAVTVLSAVVIFAKSVSLSASAINLFSMASIFLTCGTIFILFMYQMWEFNEIRRMRRIEECFSSLAREVSHMVSRRERNVERYTMLAFMISVLIVTTVIELIAIR